MCSLLPILFTVIQVGFFDATEVCICSKKVDKKAPRVVLNDNISTCRDLLDKASEPTLYD